MAQRPGFRPQQLRHAVTPIQVIRLLHWEFTTVGDDDVLGRGATAAANRFDGADDVHAFTDGAEHDVATCVNRNAREQELR